MQPYNQKNIQQAKQAAQRIFKRVNFQGGNLQSYQLSALLQQTYDFLKIPFKPSTNDVKEYSKVLDANGDGAVSLSDLQNLAIQYLCGDGVLSGLNTSKGSQGMISQSNSSSPSRQNRGSNESINLSSNQNIKRASFGQRQNSFNNSGAMISGPQSQQLSSVNNGRMSYSGSGNYQNLVNSGHSIQSQGRGSFSNQGSLQSNSYGPSNFNHKEQIQSRQVHLTRPSLVEQDKKKYTQAGQNYISVIRGIFRKYCNQNTNTITRDKVSPLLNQTYGVLGRKDYNPSTQDINLWMKLCDTNGDGHVEQAEYEFFVTRSLQRSGAKIFA